jgi:hypothetical protein
LEPVNSVDRIAEEHFGAGGTTPATANAVDVPVLFNTTTGQVPYHLGDVVLFVSRWFARSAAETGTGIATVDPFTGARSKRAWGTFGQVQFSATLPYEGRKGT